MIINLKQNEIEQALRAYVAAQGISLSGKELTIAFTAGRRESGISAEISIDDVEIPGFTNDVYVPEVNQAKTPVLSLAPAVVTETPVPAEPIGAEQGEVPVQTEDLATDSVTEEGAESVKKTVSLFG